MPLSNTYANTIYLVNSRDYLRVISLLYLFTGWVISQSGLHGLLQGCLIVLLVLQYQRIWKCPQPAPDLQGFIMKESSLICLDKQGGEVEYDQVKRLVDAGFFQLIQLTGSGKKRIIPVFADQCSEEDLYRLRRFLFS